MAKLSLERALLSASWEIEPRYGLQQLARYVDGDVTEPTNAEEEQRATIYNAEGIEVRESDYGQEVAPGSVAVITMSGAMRLESGFCSRGVQETIADLRAADSNPNVRGILFQVNSGGGESTAGTELANAIFDIREGGRTRIYTYFQMLASAALRGTLHSHRTFAASASSGVGSVGSYISLNRRIINQLKESYDDIYAKQSTMKNASFRAYLNGDSGPLEEEVTQHAQFFIDAVENAKPGMSRNSEEARRLRAGDMFTGQEAAAFGLIDGVATFGQVLAMLLAEEEQQPTFNNGPMATNNDAMTQTKKRSIITRINDFLTGNSINEDATLDQISEVLDEELQETEDEEPELETEEAPEEVQETPEEEVEETEDEEATDTNDAVTSALERIEAQMTVLAEDNADLRKKLAAAQAKVAKSKAGGKQTTKSGNPVPKASSFKTVKRVNGVKPGNGAKYSADNK